MQDFDDKSKMQQEFLADIRRLAYSQAGRAKKFWKSKVTRQFDATTKSQIGLD